MGIEGEFESLRELYGEHYTDRDYMEKSTPDIAKRLYLIDDKIDKVHMELQ